jgi:hypothetical protein
MRRAALAEAGAHLRHLTDSKRITASSGHGGMALYALSN